MGFAFDKQRTWAWRRKWLVCVFSWQLNFTLENYPEAADNSAIQILHSEVDVHVIDSMPNQSTSLPVPSVFHCCVHCQAQALAVHCLARPRLLLAKCPPSTVGPQGPSVVRLFSLRCPSANQKKYQNSSSREESFGSDKQTHVANNLDLTTVEGQGRISAWRPHCIRWVVFDWFVGIHKPLHGCVFVCVWGGDLTKLTKLTHVSKAERDCKSNRPNGVMYVS